MTFWDFLSNSWNGFARYVEYGSHHILNTIRATMLVLMLFKVVEMSMEQQIGVIGLVESVLQGIQMKTTVPARRIEEKKAAAFEKGIIEGVRQSESGAGNGTRHG